MLWTYPLPSAPTQLPHGAATSVLLNSITAFTPRFLGIVPRTGVWSSIQPLPLEPDRGPVASLHSTTRLPSLSQAFQHFPC